MITTINEFKKTIIENIDNKVAHRDRFYVVDKDYIGWTFKDNWNGFAVPYFEKDVADEIATDLGGIYDVTLDGYQFTNESDEMYTGQDIKTTDGERHVYCLGGYSWVWSIVTESNNAKWNNAKQVRELETEIQHYERHAKREIENNKIARKDKVRNNSQRFLQTLYKKYKDLTGKDYDKPKFEIKY